MSLDLANASTGNTSLLFSGNLRRDKGQKDNEVIKVTEEYNVSLGGE